jgi:serine/threonine protein kinase
MAWASTELADLDSGGAVDLGDIICHHDGLHSQRNKKFLEESFIWHILFHLSAALALCHHGLQVTTEKVVATSGTKTVLERLTQTPPEHLVRLSESCPRIKWTTERVRFSVKASHEPIIHRDIKPRNGE